MFVHRSRFVPTECHRRVLSQREDDTPSVTAAADRPHTDEEEGAPRPHRHEPHRPRRRDHPGPHHRSRTRPPGPGPARGPRPPAPTPPHDRHHAPRHRIRTSAPLPRRRARPPAPPPPGLCPLRAGPVIHPSITGVLSHPASAHASTHAPHKPRTTGVSAATSPPLPTRHPPLRPCRCPFLTGFLTTNMKNRCRQREHHSHKRR